MTTKICRICGEESPISNFHEHPHMADGHLHRCKKCMSIKRKMRYIPHARKPRVEPTSKVCKKCGAEKFVSEFYCSIKNSTRIFSYKCKECTKRDVHDNYSDNRKYYAIYEQERFKKPKRKEKILEYQRNRRAKNPDKYIANQALSNALRDGRIQRQPCSVCGQTKTEGHHPDYSKPIDVIWLCRKHHLELHSKQAYEFG